MKSTHTLEVDAAERFQFGANWWSFLNTLEEKRIDSAIDSIKTMLGVNNLTGKSFLDIGCGSGLFSLAAMRLGARVHSFDYDPKSVACANEMKRRYYPENASWIIEEGSILNKNYLNSLGKFDIVYSWGVLHHTGCMYQAIENASKLVKDNGLFFIAIYNDQGGASKRWFSVKKVYNKLPPFLRVIYVLLIASSFEFKYALARLLKGENPLPFKDWNIKKKDRGMSAWHDWVDWVGGLPFEVAKPEEIIIPLINENFVLANLTTNRGGLGCNQYVFKYIRKYSE